MDVIITMAGLGSRFRKAGFLQPKYKIVVRGKTLFQWSMESLTLFRREHYIFLVRKEDGAEEFIREKCRELGINNISIMELEKVTRGQAETAMLAASVWQENEPIMIYNIDTYVEPGQLFPEMITGDGFIPCFKAEGSHWSFVKLDEYGNAVEVREKVRISDNCSVGAYYFGSGRLYKDIYKRFYVDRGYIEKNERYIAPMYNLLIADGLKVYIQDIPANKVHVLGTPEEVDAFAKK